MLRSAQHGILHHAAEGERGTTIDLNNREIADELTISEKSVKTHVSSILSKLHLEDHTQAAVYTQRQGLAPDGA